MLHIKKSVVFVWLWNWVAEADWDKGRMLNQIEKEIKENT